MEPGVLIEIARALAPAAGLGLVGFAAAWLPRRAGAGPNSPPPVAARLAAPVIFSMAVAATYPIITNQPPRLVPHSITDWLPHIALASMLVGLLAGTLCPSMAVRLIVRTGLLAAIATALLWKSIPQWPLTTTVGWYAVFILPTMVGWSAWQRVADRNTGATVPFLLLGWAGCASQVIIFTGSESLGRSVACIAAAAGAAVPIALIRRSFSLARGGCAVPAAVIPAILLVHAQTAPDEEVARLGPLAALLFLVPVLAALIDEPTVCGLRGLPKEVVRITVAAIPGLLAVALALSGVNLAEY